MKKLFLLCFLLQWLSENLDATMISARVQYIGQSRFIPPMDLHFIESVNNVASTTLCAAICDRHIVCRTADFNSVTKQCRLFESLASAGSSEFDATTTIFALNYCQNENQREPDYVCTRSGVYTIQEMFNRFNASTSISLLSTNRGAYANMHGVYTSSTGGVVSFFTYTGQRTGLVSISGEITSINSATRNGLVIVQYALSSATVYRNQGTPSSPNFVQILSITLPSIPCGCVATDQYLYIVYMNKHPMTVHDLSTGSLLLNDSSGISENNYRPAITQWKNTITLLDQYRMYEFNLTGEYLGTRSYFPYQGNVRHYIHYDYAGRRYICNGSGNYTGIFAFSLNDTQLGQATNVCDRGMYVYITKEQAVFVVASSSYMKMINF